MKYKNLILYILINLIVISCVNKEETIKVGLLNGPSVVSFIQMIDSDIEINGQKLEFIIKEEPLHIQSLMLQNKLDFAVLPTIMAANLYNKGADYKVIGISIWGSLYLVERREDVDFEGMPEENYNLSLPERINNKKIHVFGQASTADILFRKMLKDQNIEDVQIDYSYGSNMELANAILQKKIKSAIISEPLVSSLINKDPNIKITSKITIEEDNKSRENNSFAQTSLVVNSRLSENNIETIKAFSNLYQYSCDISYQDHNKTAESLVKNGFFTDIKVAQNTIPNCNIKFKYASDIRKEIEEYLKIFYTFEPRSIGGKMPNKDFIFDIN